MTLPDLHITMKADVRAFVAGIEAAQKKMDETGVLAIPVAVFDTVIKDGEILVTVSTEDAADGSAPGT